LPVSAARASLCLRAGVGQQHARVRPTASAAERRTARTPATDRPEPNQTASQQSAQLRRTRVAQLRAACLFVCLFACSLIALFGIAVCELSLARFAVLVRSAPAIDRSRCKRSIPRPPRSPRSPSVRLRRLRAATSAARHTTTATCNGRRRIEESPLAPGRQRKRIRPSVKRRAERSPTNALRRRSASLAGLVRPVGLPSLSDPPPAALSAPMSRKPLRCGLTRPQPRL
jgi:hypothetical protein